jgi:hypothetical protein
MKNLFLGLLMLAGTTATFANSTNNSAKSNNLIENSNEIKTKSTKTFSFDADDSQSAKKMLDSLKVSVTRDIIIIIFDDGTIIIIVIE